MSPRTRGGVASTVAAGVHVPATAQGFFISRLTLPVLVDWLRKRGTEEPPQRMRLVAG